MAYLNGEEVMFSADVHIDNNEGVIKDYIDTQKGVANGLAELDESGKVPASQLPSYVDSVTEYNGKSAFPTTGESGKIYVDSTTNKTYRWSGSTYIEISASLALGETSSTAYAGDKGAELARKVNAMKTKTMTFTLEDDSTVSYEVYVK